MKKLLIFTLIGFTFLGCNKDESKDYLESYNCKDRFYYYKSEKITLTEVSYQAIISFYDALSDEEINQVVEQYEAINLVATRSEGKHVIVSIDSENCTFTDNLFAQIKNDSKVSNCQKFLTTEKSNLVGVYDIFVCQLKSSTTQSQVNELIKETNTDVIESSNVRFKIRADKNSNGDALDMANRFFESDYFEFAEPEFISDWTN